MNVLFVTSFTPSLFAATGERLIRSFLDTKTQAAMLVCHEDFAGVARFRHRRLRTFRISRSVLLREWLAKNRDIIPTRFGGTAEGCGCPEPDNPFSAHRPRCHNSWFNHHAARWFRKIVALEYATSLNEYSHIVWLDCDCVFKARIPGKEVRRWFNGNAVFYLKSGARQAIESGVLGVRNTTDGRRFVAAAVDRYRSGIFRRNVRWDDGYQLHLVLRSHPYIPAIDLADGSIGGRYGHVVPCSPVGPFIKHEKGINAVRLGWI
jgi:hypothetical protein